MLTNHNLRTFSALKILSLIILIFRNLYEVLSGIIGL